MLKSNPFWFHVLHEEIPAYTPPISRSDEENTGYIPLSYTGYTGSDQPAGPFHKVNGGYGFALHGIGINLSTQFRCNYSHGKKIKIVDNNNSIISLREKDFYICRTNFTWN